jgi:hypothetical protein
MVVGNDVVDAVSAVSAVSVSLIKEFTDTLILKGKHVRLPVEHNIIL